MDLHTLMAADLSTVVLGDLADCGTLRPDGGALLAPLRGLLVGVSAAALQDQRGVVHEQTAVLIVVAAEAAEALQRCSAGRDTLRRGDVFETQDTSRHPGRWIITAVRTGHAGQLRADVTQADRHATAPRNARAVR
jgi:hypothetical protein